MERYYAHSLPDRSIDNWELMSEHESRVSQYCRAFLARIDPALSPWGELLGRWHDLGKYSQAFQNYLLRSLGDAHQLESQGKVDHSTAGAIHAINQFPESSKPISHALAFCIAGHHAGLANAVAEGTPRPLQDRLNKTVEDYVAPESVLAAVPLQFAPRLYSTFQEIWTKVHHNQNAKEHIALGSFSWAFFVRMLFSCLVDADFLATEQFMSPETFQQRPQRSFNFGDLRLALDREIATLNQNRTGKVHEIRQEILAACNNAATSEPGLFSLTVPTGGGKTLASLSFALRHIEANPSQRFERIVVAIPFTSIIEQTSRVYKGVFHKLGGNIVLESHSNVETGNETQWSRLASQNFDAPIVVTTNLQLFESLFSNRPRQCRKIHNLARSIIVLDEAQTFPVELLQPTLLAIQELVKHYACSVVLCTATQPSLTNRNDFPIGLPEAQEIIPKSLNLYERMRRVKVEFIGERSIEALAAELSQNKQFLCIQNTRPDATKTYRSLQAIGDCDGLFLLSTFTCPRHRTQILKKIRNRLKERQICRVVSTQLIEAGVDVDFPVVYRAIAGLDSIAQAAGRCNREGKLTNGVVRVFKLPNRLPPGMLTSTADTTIGLLDQFANDLIAPVAVEAYFRMHYWRNESLWDRFEILPMHKDARLAHIEFADIALAYKIIRDTSIRVVVPYGKKGRRLQEHIRKSDPIGRPLTREDRKEIERFSISLFENVVLPNIGKDFEYTYDGQYILLSNPSLYDDEVGFDGSRLGFIDPGTLIV